MYVVTARQMREIDRYAIERLGIPEAALMENAGRVVAEQCAELFRDGCHRLLILAGKGNNGGDGLVAARHLLELGFTCHIVYAADPGTFSGQAAAHARVTERLKLPARVYGEPDGDIDWRQYDGIVDALLGTGSAGAPRGNVAKLIEEANQSGLPIISVDLPSGLDADTGQVHLPCIRAVRTIALGFTKRGLEQFPGREYAGDVVVQYIGIPEQAAETADVRAYRIDGRVLKQKLGIDRYDERQENTHKGTYGHVLVAAGSRPMSGAGLLAAQATLRAGCGLVTWAMPDRLLDAMAGRFPEAMLAGLADGGRGDWSLVRAEDVAELTDGKDALLVGPGVGQWPDGVRFMRVLWEAAACPLVLDADALNLIAQAPDFAAWPARQAPVIVTPHPGEMARLTGMPTAEVQRDRMKAAQHYAVHYGVTVVLKGARTVVASPDGELFVNGTGNPGMATGGAGDVLAGLIAGLVAQRMTAAQASALGVYLHGAAGDRARLERAREASLIAGDIIRHL